MKSTSSLQNTKCVSPEIQTNQVPKYLDVVTEYNADSLALDSNYQKW